MHYPDFTKLKSPGRLVGVDIETTPIDEHGDIDKFWCITWYDGISNHHVYWPNGISKVDLAHLFANIDVIHALGRDKQSAKLLELKELLTGEECTPAFHSAQFDAQHLQSVLDETLAPYICTQQLAYVILPPAVMGSTGDEDALRFYSLAHLASMGLCEAKVRFDEGFEQFSTEMLEYCEQDSKSCWQLAHIMMPMLNSSLLEAFILDMGAQLMCYKMTQRGLLINQDKLLELTLKYEKELDRIEDELRDMCPAVLSEKEYELVRTPNQRVYPKEMYGVQDIGCYVVLGHRGGMNVCRKVEQFNVGKRDHLQFFLEKFCGFKPTKFSKKTKKPVLDKSVVEKLADYYYPAQLIMQHRQYAKLLSTYMKPFKHVDQIGRIHPSFLTCATRTSRLASRKPNFQNVPKGDCRSLVVAPPNHKLVCIDLSQIELRILAWYMATLLSPTIESRTFMWEQFAADKDIHDANAQRTNKPRKAVKVGIFLYIYGGQEARMAASLGMSPKEAADFMHSLETQLPALPAIRTLFHEAALKHKTLYTMYGHQIRYPKLFADTSSRGEKMQALRQYFNAAIQGSQSDIIKILMWQVRKLLIRFGASLLLQVHDELVFEVPEGNVGLFCDALMPLFNNNYLLRGLVVKAIPGIGNSWLEAKEDGERREKESKTSIVV